MPSNTQYVSKDEWNEKNPGGTTRISLGEAEFDCMDDFGEDEFLDNDYKNIYFIWYIPVDR